jgi:tRNA(Ile)-lysidine synthase
VRKEIIPRMKALNPAFEQAALRMSASLRADCACLNALSVQLLESARCAGGWRSAPLADAMRAVRLRAVRLLFLEYGAPYDEGRILRVEALVRAGQGRCSAGGGFDAVCTRGVLSFCKAGDEPPAKARQIDLSTLIFPARFRLTGGRELVMRQITSPELKFFVKKDPKAFKNTLDCAKMGKIVTLRARQPQDRIRLLGRGCTKSLKKLQSEAGIPRLRRQYAAVLESGGRPVWAEGFGASEDAAAGPDCARAVWVSVGPAQPANGEERDA